jgi:lysophospholipase L1-like esterase
MLSRNAMQPLRRLAAALLPFTLATCLHSQTETPPAPPRPVPSTTTPSDSNERARPTNYQRCRERVAAANAPGHRTDLLFVGDSITEAWTDTAWGGENRGATVWQKFYASRNALNFGVGADTTQNVLYRFSTMDVKNLSPKVTILLIGTNNTRNTAQEIADGVHAVLDRIRTLYPATKIILVSILPNERAGALMTEANSLIRPLADEKTIFYLDLVPVFPRIGDHWLGLGRDNLHPTDAGYQIWAETMEPLLDRLLGAAAAP